MRYIDIETKLARLDDVAAHIGRGYDILHDLGYREQADILLEMIDELGNEMGNLEAELDEQEAE